MSPISSVIIVLDLYYIGSGRIAVHSGHQGDDFISLDTPRQSSLMRVCWDLCFPLLFQNFPHWFGNCPHYSACGGGDVEVCIQIDDILL